MELLFGGSGVEVITLGNSGNTTTLVNIETLVGGSGTDKITLGNGGQTVAVSGVETLTGGMGNDVITASGSINVQGKWGADTITLASGAGTDMVVFGHYLAEGPEPGVTTGYDLINNFQVGTDDIGLTSRLRSDVDDNLSGALTVASRATGAVNMTTDEVVFLSTTVTTLADTDFASFRAALGAVTSGTTFADVLVVANDGSSTGLYMVIDVMDVGTISASEVRLLGVVNGTVLTSADLALV
ncbi:MAG: hypothetical protein HQL41_09615 [Alphaproteobacteria bacterium]|nr:hypothetical protein [Alphaproteobacteria bacterium]